MKSKLKTKMKQLNKIQSIIFLLGGSLMVIGAGCFVFMWHQRVVCWIFALGAVMFAVMQAMQIYEGNSLTIKRLKRIMSLADILFIVSAFLMIDTAYQLLLPLFQDGNGMGYINYVDFIYNKWVITLLIAALLELYTTHRIGSELKKEERK